MPSAPEAPQPLPETGTVASNGRNGTLLVVDDEEGPRRSLRVIFQDDYQVLMAADGLGAVELARNNRIDVAIVDIRMCGMSGIEVLERLKYVDPNIEVIMLTAFETTDTMRQALRFRACDYINKPFDLSTMRIAVGRAMQRRMLSGEIHSDAAKLQQLLEELQNQQIEEKMSQTRGEIYASIIHDLNGPLTVISGFVQLMNQRIGSATRLELEDLQFVKDRLRTIMRQATNCIEISRRYLSFLRRQPDDFPNVGVNELLTDLDHLIRVHPSRQENRFSIEPFPQNIAVRMNGTDLIQVLLNLVVNAFQCSAQAHPVRIRGSVLTAPLNLTEIKDGPNDRLLNVENFENNPPLAEFCVCDNGPGIAPELLPKIFQPYFTTKRGRNGTGLGLNIVQRLVKEGKGILQLHTAVGEGTTFRVVLPAVQLNKV